MTAASAATPNPQRHQFPPDTCMDVDDGYVCKERKGHAGQHVGASDTTVHCWESRVDPVREQLVRALKEARITLDETGKNWPIFKSRVAHETQKIDAALKLAETQKD